jgi:hypothetical protein
MSPNSSGVSTRRKTKMHSMDRDWISAYNICIINWIIFEWLSSQLDSTTGESTDMYVTMRKNLNKAKYNTIFCISISLLNKSSTLFWRTSRGTNDLSSYSFNAGYSVSISLSWQVDEKVPSTREIPLKLLNNFTRRIKWRKCVRVKPKHWNSGWSWSWWSWCYIDPILIQD